MSERIIVEATVEEIEKARLNCIRQGSSFQEFLTECVRAKAKEKIADRDAVLHESLLIKEIWAPSRATLFSMRQSGELKEGVEGNSESGFYYTKNGSIYYYLAKLRQYFKKNYPHIEKANRAKLDSTASQESDA